MIILTGALSLNGEESETQVMEHGLSQASVLGPPFLIYINDLNASILYTVMLRFFNFLCFGGWRLFEGALISSFHYHMQFTSKT